MPMAMSIEDAIEKWGEALIQRLRHQNDVSVRSLVGELVEFAKRDRTAVAQETRREAEAEAVKKLEAERARMRAEAEQTHAGELEAARTKARQALQEKLAAARAEADTTLAAEVAKVRAKAEQVLAAELGCVRADATASARADEWQASNARLQRLLDSVRALGEARSLSQVLDILTDRTVAEAPRVAVLMVQAARVRGWRFLGFAKIREAGSVDLAVQEAGLIGRAIAESEVCSVRAGPAGAPAGSLPSFAALPSGRTALAVPVHVGGRVAAVVYADDATDSDERQSAGWQSTAELLARYAGHCLETLTAVRVSQLADGGQSTATQSPQSSVAARQPVDDTEDAARRYVRLLLSEIKLYNEAAVKAGREGRDLFERLRPEIERARGLYEERISPSLKTRNLCFDQELVRTLADGDPSLLEG